MGEIWRLASRRQKSTKPRWRKPTSRPQSTRELWVCVNSRQPEGQHTRQCSSVALPLETLRMSRPRWRQYHPTETDLYFLSTVFTLNIVQRDGVATNRVPWW